MSGSLNSILRTVFFALDTAVYWLVEQVTWLFSMLTEASIFTQDQIRNFSSRIYVLISIVMLFKLGFSFITYIVSPDSMSDKQKGGGKLVTNIVIAFVVLVSVPTIFNELYFVQGKIISTGVIERVLLGVNVTQEQKVERSKLLSTYAFLTFFRPTDAVTECRTFTGIDISPD